MWWSHIPGPGDKKDQGPLPIAPQDSLWKAQQLFTMPLEASTPHPSWGEAVALLIPYPPKTGDGAPRRDGDPVAPVLDLGSLNLKVSL